MEATVKLMLDTRKAAQRRDGTSPAVIRVTYNREQRRYMTGRAYTEEDFKAILGSPRKKAFKEEKEVLLQIESKATGIKKQLGKNFSFDDFKKLFTGKGAQDTNSVYALWEAYIEDLKSEGRAKTAISYTNALTAFRKHRKRLAWQDLTPKFLKGFEAQFLADGKSRTSVGIYTRSLRTICNLAIEKGYMKPEGYPFGKRKYTPPKGSNVKKALEPADLKKLIQYETDIPNERKYLDLWLFSFLCNGMNMKDIALLKHGNIEGHNLHYTRAKTSKSTDTIITIPLLPEARAIIERWATDADKGGYLFNLIPEGRTPEAIVKDVQQLVKMTNKYVRQVAKKLGIRQDITTYSARHSYATTLLRAGVGIAAISQGLGHTNVQTTENYLGSFTDEQKAAIQSKLTEL